MTRRKSPTDLTAPCPRSLFDVPGTLAAALCVACLAAALAGGDEAVEEPNAADALRAALERNLELSESWLRDGDFKSLCRTAGGIPFLVAALRRQSGDAQWMEACDQAAKAVARLQAAARMNEAALCREALAECRARAAALAEMSLERPTEPLRSSSGAARGGLGAMMALLDGTFADAKVALTAGHVDRARREAKVLAELADLMVDYQDDAGWKSQTAAFQQAARAVAATREQEPKAVRQLLRGVYQRCEACHNARR